jgi:uncharacterized protein (TIGR03437 family)
MVTVNGIPAPLFSVSGSATSQQVDLQVPFEAASAADAYEVEISQNGLSAWVEGLPTVTTPPGIFTLDGTYGAIQHASNYGLVTSADPALPGEAIILYATGLGPVSPPVPSGSPAAFVPISRTTAAPQVTISGLPAQVLFSGLVPGTVGLYQLNVLVPAGVPGGDQDVVVSFPPLNECCILGTLFFQSVPVNSAPVKITLQ